MYMLHFVEVEMLLLYTGYYFRFSCHFKCYACYASWDEVTACRIYLLYPSFLSPLVTFQKPTKNLFQDVHTNIQHIFCLGGWGSPIPLACANENAYDGELGNISLQSFSPEVQARHSVLKQLDLDRVAEWSQEKGKCLTWFRRERVHYANWRRHNKEAEGGLSVGQYCSDTFSFTSLNLNISRFLASVRNSECERWSNQERFWLFLS